MKKFSGEEVNRAGERLLSSDVFSHERQFSEVMEVLSYWRSEHNAALARAVERIQYIAQRNDRKAIFAKRLKRFASIVLKLRRFPSMSLRNVQDIGGCRAIFSSRKKLIQTLRDLKRLQEFRWADGRTRIKDYIQAPKPDGYRSVHIIGLFPGESGLPRRIEVQLRTRIQHYWATALEIVDLFTQQALKSNQGDPVWREFFRELGGHFELMDSIHLFETMSLAAKRRAYRDRIRADLVHQQSAKEIRACCKKLGVMKKFEAYAGSLVVVDEQLSGLKQAGFVLLKIDLDGQKVDSTVFADGQSRAAEAQYTSLEAATATVGGVVVALVSSTAVGGIKEAYPNYFADSSEFIQLLSLILED